MTKHRKHRQSLVVRGFINAVKFHEFLVRKGIDYLCTDIEYGASPNDYEYQFQY
jgi:hypothetical protein